MFHFKCKLLEIFRSFSFTIWSVMKIQFQANYNSYTKTTWNVKVTISNPWRSQHFFWKTNHWDFSQHYKYLYSHLSHIIMITIRYNYFFLDFVHFNKICLKMLIKTFDEKILEHFWKKGFRFYNHGSNNDLRQAYQTGVPIACPMQPTAIFLNPIVT